jgi:hypothetical protein
MNKLLFLLAFITACDTPTNQPIDLTVESAAFHLRGVQASSSVAAITALRETPPLRDPVLSSELSKQFHWLEKDAEHDSWILGVYASPREMFCHESSECVADRVVSWRNLGAITVSPSLSLYQIMITSHRGTFQARAGDQDRVLYSHQVSIFRSPKGEISVFDPILMPDARLHSLSDLLNRLENPAGLQFSIVRR